MARYHDGDFSNPAGIHRIGMIVNVNDGRPQRRDFFSEPWPKENELVDIRQPLRHEAAGPANLSQERLRLDHLRGNARRSEALEHHRGEPLHALLPIERIVTNQENHRSREARPKNGATVRRGESAGLIEDAPAVPAPKPPFPPKSSLSCWRKRDKGRSRRRRIRGWWAGRIGR